MHLIELGVMRKFLARIYYNNVINKVSKQNQNSISTKLMSMQPFIPAEYARKPRTLLERPNWKSTEFRQFLLYTGIVALKDSIFDDQYYLFVLLHCAYRLLCSQKQRENNIENAQQILKLFVESFPIVFGANSVTYNVHGLLHVRDTINQVENPASGSSYSFENYLQLLKICVRKKSFIFEGWSSK